MTAPTKNMDASLNSDEHPNSQEKHPWLEWIKQVHAIAHWGLTYAKDPFDLERYEALQSLSVAMMADFTTLDKSRITTLFDNEPGYVTPKVDVRGVVFKDRQLLMIRENLDGLWTIPGGWADIGLSPRQVVVKEVQEEAGLNVEAGKLLAVLDKQFYRHPVSAFHIYKIFIQCHITGGELATGLESTDVGFFSLDNLPPLSSNRITQQQIELLFAHLNDPSRPTDLS
ncbi:MAG: NUDIX hydrolase [Cyanobacteria bacterium P01_H01_bin.74]